MSHEIYSNSMLAFERHRAKDDYPKALEAIDTAIDHCEDGYALVTLTKLRKETADEVKERTPGKSLAQWWDGFWNCRKISWPRFRRRKEARA
jgi:hypothetical protein